MGATGKLMGVLCGKCEVPGWLTKQVILDHSIFKL